MSDLKLYFINGISLLTAQFTNLDNILKILLLVITIGYTINKWYFLNKKK